MNAREVFVQRTTLSREENASVRSAQREALKLRMEFARNSLAQLTSALSRMNASELHAQLSTSSRMEAVSENHVQPDGLLKTTFASLTARRISSQKTENASDTDVLLTSSSSTKSARELDAQKDLKRSETSAKLYPAILDLS